MILLQCLLLSWFCLSLSTTRVNKRKCDQVLFEKFSRSPLPYSVLQSAANDPSSLFPCTLNTELQKGNSIVVVLAISDCLNDEDFEIIRSWIDQLGSKADTTKYLKNRDNVQLKFHTVIVNGNCPTQPINNHQYQTVNNYGDSTNNIELKGPYATARTLVASTFTREAKNRKRAAIFSVYGKVLPNFPPMYAPDRPVAVISFSNDITCLKRVISYQQVVQVENNFNFQICDSGSICQAENTDGFKLRNLREIFLFNPISSLRSWQCPSLKNGIPVSYLDASNNPNCFCGCPAGYTIDAGRESAQCIRKETEQCSCTWSNEGPFYHEVKPGDNFPQCPFSNISSSWKIPVPFPFDSFTSGKRTISLEDKHEVTGSRIELGSQKKSLVVYEHGSISTQLNGKECDQKQPLPSKLKPNKVKPYPDSYPSSSPSTYSWNDYHKDGQSRIDMLTFPGYGQYALTLTAYDLTGSYDKAGKTPQLSSSKCEGCLAIIDKTRPRKTETCPTRFCEGSECESSAGFAVSTVSNLDRANSAIMDLYKVQQTASNDACSVQNRCDEELFELKDFFATTYIKQSNYRSGEECFNSDHFRLALLRSSSTKTNPFGSTDILQKSVPVAEGQCQRCCRLSMKLQERWVDYSCNFKFYTERCEGIFGEGCELDQCLQFHGDTLVTATASVAPSYMNDSAIVKKSLPNGELQTQTQIHRSLDCTESNPDCIFKASMDSLIVRHENFNFDLLDKNSEFPAANYVFWRYKVSSDSSSQWQQFAEHQEQAWKSNETEIIVEAWTQCGLAYRSTFNIVLRRVPPVTICNYFPSMWYQATTPRPNAGNALCSYKKSNFLELTFNYHPNVGSTNSPNHPDARVSNIMCTIEYQGTPATEILRKECSGSEVVKHFAIDLPRTQPSTDSVITRCQFTYTDPSGGSNTQRCDQTFSIAVCQDSDKAVADPKCKSDTCPATKSSVYELCYGNRIFMTPDRRTVLTEIEKGCCPTCGARASCVPILKTQGNAKSLMRCEPTRPPPAPKNSAYGQANSNYRVLTSNTLLSRDSIQEGNEMIDEQNAPETRQFPFKTSDEVPETERPQNENVEVPPTLESNEDKKRQFIAGQAQNQNEVQASVDKNRPEFQVHRTFARNPEDIISQPGQGDNQEFADIKRQDRGPVRPREYRTFKKNPTLANVRRQSNDAADNEQIPSFQGIDQRFKVDATPRRSEYSTSNSDSPIVPYPEQGPDQVVDGQGSVGPGGNIPLVQNQGEWSPDIGVNNPEAQENGQGYIGAGGYIPPVQNQGQGSPGAVENYPVPQVSGRGYGGASGGLLGGLLSPLTQILGRGRGGASGNIPPYQNNAQGYVDGRNNVPREQGTTYVVPNNKSSRGPSLVHVSLGGNMPGLIGGQGAVSVGGNNPGVHIGGQGSLGVGGILPGAQIGGQGSVGVGGNIPLVQVQGQGSLGVGGNNPGSQVNGRGYGGAGGGLLGGLFSPLHQILGPGRGNARSNTPSYQNNSQGYVDGRNNIPRAQGSDNLGLTSNTPGSVQASVDGNVLGLIGGQGSVSLGGNTPRTNVNGQGSVGGGGTIPLVQVRGQGSLGVGGNNPGLQVNGQGSLGVGGNNVGAQVTGQGSVGAGARGNNPGLQVNGQGSLGIGGNNGGAQVNDQGSLGVGRSNAGAQVNDQGSVGVGGNNAGAQVNGQGSLGVGRTNAGAQVNGQGSVGAGGNIPLIQAKGQGSVGVGGNNPRAQINGQGFVSARGLLDVGENNSAPSVNAISSPDQHPPQAGDERNVQPPNDQIQVIDEGNTPRDINQAQESSILTSNPPPSAGIYGPQNRGKNPTARSDQAILSTNGGSEQKYQQNPEKALKKAKKQRPFEAAVNVGENKTSKDTQSGTSQFLKERDSNNNGRFNTKDEGYVRVAGRVLASASNAATSYISQPQNHAAQLAVMGSAFLGVIILAVARRRRQSLQVNQYAGDAYFELLS
uniref:Uncharacterized protein AlNc14C48G3826 n=1 Tax=Albugo laibachii Nc14 TaxID=890382 RepID=F0WAW5_9STRA|nr:conserved hypothetical protein [Albugo laibachii Nc14]CCA18439.1 conserved hypothetical protein [Albugo laibachii Nc14]|eukprot:CCA18439.1 conserved hypothetical protein [Albugo laibachii Nc14]